MAKQQREAAEVQFIHAEYAAEILEDLSAMLGHIELFGTVAEHVIDEPRGQVQQELTSERLHSLFDVHSILEDPIEHQVADFVVVAGSGKHTLGSCPERLAAVTPGRYSPQVISR